MNGAQIVLECLTREKVEVIFGYPGGVTLPFYDAIYDSPIKHVLVRHEQNAAFAAQGYARATGKVGVCCATSGPGATNLVTGLVDAMMDSIPIVAITGQVTSKLIGSDAFQEADTFGITRSGTKHNFLVKTLAELPRAIHEAFHIASTRTPRTGAGRYHQGRVPGQRPLHAGDLDSSAGLSRLHRRPRRPDPPRGAGHVGSQAPVGLRGRRHHPRGSARRIAPVSGNDRRSSRHHFDGRWAVCPANHPNFISMPGMHGSYAANMGMTETDLLIALGSRFDDRVTGRLRRLRAARQGDSRGYRSGRSGQDPHAGCAHRGRREESPAERFWKSWKRRPAR